MNPELCWFTEFDLYHGWFCGYKKLGFRPGFRDFQVMYSVETELTYSDLGLVSIDFPAPSNQKEHMVYNDCWSSLKSKHQKLMDSSNFKEMIVAL